MHRFLLFKTDVRYFASIKHSIWYSVVSCRDAGNSAAMAHGMSCIFKYLQTVGYAPPEPPKQSSYLQISLKLFIKFVLAVFAYIVIITVCYEMMY